MSLPANTRQMTQVESFTLQVIGDEQREADLWRALPDHVKPERFKRNFINLIMQKPEMLKHEPRLVFREVSKAAALGLLLDPQLGEAYIVPVWNAKANRSEPELRCGYRGLIKLGRQSGEIANLYPGEVREHDHFLADEGTEKRLEHRPDYTRPRGKPLCYYAVVIYKDGTKDFEVMDTESIYRIREKSDGYRAFKAGKIKSTPWVSDEGEMCKKTPLRRLMKRVPQSPELADALALESTADNREERQLHPVRHLQAVEQPRTIAARLDAFAEEAAAPETEEPFEPESAAGDPSPAAEPPSVAPDGKPAPSSPVDGAGPDPIDEARQAGRDACDASTDYNAVPAAFNRYVGLRKAWKAGYEERARELEAEMNAA